jgi:hypothetical protein
MSSAAVDAMIREMLLSLARALDKRGEPGDRERAVELAAEAQQLTPCSLRRRRA